MVLTNLYSGFQTVVPASIRKELNLKLEDSLDWSIEDGKMIIEIKYPYKLNFSYRFFIYFLF